SATINVLNDDSSARTQKNADGTTTNVTMNIPIYQLITPGGDTQMIGNFEYRIPIVGPVNLAIFGDAGFDKILLTNQLRMDPARVAYLNNESPQAVFDGRGGIPPEPQRPRASTGLELRVMLPVVNPPFRLYGAFNPLIVREYLQPPIVVDRS